MSSTVKERSFWSSTSGVLTGIAGTVTGVVTLVSVGAQMGWIGGDGDDPAGLKSQGPGVTQPSTSGTASGGAVGGGPATSGGARGSTGATTPTFTVDPTRVTFEPLGNRKATIKVMNTGSVAATVESPSVEGTNPSQFTATAPTCTRAALAPGRTCEVEVTFAPQKPGTYAASLVVQVSGARPQELALSGSALLG